MRSAMGQSKQLLAVAVVVGLVGVLALGGCSKKSVTATTEGADKAQAGAGATTEAVPRASGKEGKGEAKSSPGMPGQPGGQGQAGGDLVGADQVPQFRQQFPASHFPQAGVTSS